MGLCAMTASIPDKKSLRVLVFFLIVLGSLALLSYEFSISVTSSDPSLYILLLGVGSLSIGCALLASGIFKSHHWLFMILLYLLALTLISQQSFRFEVLSGADNLWEYRVARDTMAMGRWPLGMMESRAEFSSYYSSLAVTIFPAILTQVTGINLIIIFKFVFNMLGALIPVLLFVVIRNALGKIKVAAIASILYAQSEFFISIIPTHMKLMMALIFFLLTLLLIFRNNNKSATSSVRLRFLCLIFMFAVIFSHYYLVYFAIAVFFAFTISPFLMRSLPGKVLRLTKLGSSAIESAAKIFNVRLLFSFVVLAFSWFIFSSFSVFKQNIIMAREVLPSLAGLEKGVLPIAQYNPLAFQPRGPIISAWFVLLVVSTYIGLLYAWLRARKNGKTFLWISGGSALAVIFLLLMLVPGITAYLSAERVALVANIFLYSFLAMLFVAFHEISRKLRVRTIIQVLLFVFVAANLSLNMLLPAHESVILYHSANTIPIDRLITQRYNTPGGFALSNWISSDVVSNELISADARGFLELFYIKNVIVTVNGPVFAKNSTFLVIPPYFAEKSLWVVEPVARPGTLVVLKINETTNDRSNLVYDNGDCLLATKIP